MDTKELLFKLTNSIGVSGAENSITKTLVELLEPIGKVTTDSLGNVFCTFGEGYHILLDAHIDEIGLIVKDITDDGFLKVDSVGGIDRRMLFASEVTVWGRKKLRGVISTLPPHLQKEDDNKAPKIDEVSVDIGMTAESAKQFVSRGDRITFRRNFTTLSEHQISATALDNRAGVAAVILALDSIKKSNVKCKITAMFSVQEEVGTRGAAVGAFGKDVDEAIVVDTSFGYTPKCKKSDCGEIGKGPMLGISPILDKEITDGFCSLEDKLSNLQFEVMGGGRTGTNADVISLTQCGIKTGLISVPIKYMHSPVEVVDIYDINQTAMYISYYAYNRQV